MTTEPNDAHRLITAALTDPLDRAALNHSYDPGAVADLVMEALAPGWQIVRVGAPGDPYWQWLKDQQNPTTPTTAVSFQGTLVSMTGGGYVWSAAYDSIDDVLKYGDVVARGLGWRIMVAASTIATGLEPGRYQVQNVDGEHEGWLHVEKVTARPVALAQALTEAQALAVKGWMRVFEIAHGEWNADSVTELMSPEGSPSGSWGFPADAPQWLVDALRAELHATDWATA